MLGCAAIAGAASPAQPPHPAPGPEARERLFEQQPAGSEGWGLGDQQAAGGGGGVGTDKLR